MSELQITVSSPDYSSQSSQARPAENPVINNPELFLFQKFGLKQVENIHCCFADEFRRYFRKFPHADEELAAQLEDDKSRETLTLGMKRILSYPSEELCRSFFYVPIATMTAEERRTWEEHVAAFPQYNQQYHHVFDYYEPTEFYYQHGLIYLPQNVKDRLAGGIFLDCGSFNGASMMVMDRYRPKKIYGFEPSAANYRECVKNLAKALPGNHHELICSATGKKDGSVAFFDTGDSTATMQSSKNSSAAQVSIMRIDTFVRNHPESRISWIKADLEGAAGDMIRGAEETIKRDRPLLTLGVYHCPDEFFEIPKMLKRWVPEYRFMLRRCQCNPTITYNEITLLAYLP